jgi:hypothetical protein
MVGKRMGIRRIDEERKRRGIEEDWRELKID